MSEKELIKFDLRFVEWTLAAIHYHAGVFTPKEYEDMVKKYEGQIEALKKRLCDEEDKPLDRR